MEEEGAINIYHKGNKPREVNVNTRKRWKIEKRGDEEIVAGGC